MTWTVDEALGLAASDQYSSDPVVGTLAAEVERLRHEAGAYEASWAEVQHLLPAALKEVEAQQESKNRAYKERNQLVAALSRIFESHLCKHNEADASWERDWLWIVCIHAPIVGQMTWHLHDSDLSMFKHLREGSNHWDGHTNEQKYQRLGGLPFFEVVPMGPYHTLTIPGIKDQEPGPGPVLKVGP